LTKQTVNNDEHQRNAPSGGLSIASHDSMSWGTHRAQQADRALVGLPQDIRFHAAIALLTDYGTVNGCQKALPVTTANQST